MKRHGSMNRSYRLVWSEVLNAWIAVGEICRGRGKAAGRRLVALALALGCPGLAQAGPLGGQVTAGSGSVSQSGSTTTINQASPTLSLSWQSFNTTSQETVNFIQPSASSVAVNRIYDTNGTQFLGHLNANGQVYLINPNGILFGQGSQVNVGGLVASTLNIDDANLTATTRSFSGSGTGKVVNQGSIDAGYVALLGNSVSNQGSIATNGGTVALGAGSAVTLTFADNALVRMQVDQSTLNNVAENGGLIRADGGTVLLSAGAKDALLASVVNNTGVIEARSVQNVNGTIVLDAGNAGTVNVSGTLDASGQAGGGTGGTVKVLGAQVNVLAGAGINVSGDAGGGTALFGGNYQGQGLEQNATIASVATGATVNADAITQGNGGKIVVWSNEHTTVDGTFSARGGATGGNGGLVETSGKKLTVGSNTRVTTLAPRGTAGEWLLDPTDFTIGCAAANCGSLINGDMLDTTLSSNLNSGNVTILSSQGASGTNGDIILATNGAAGATVLWDSNNSLTLSAYRNVVISDWAYIGNSTGNNGNIVLRADNTGTGVGTVSLGATGMGTVGTDFGIVKIYYNPANFTANVPLEYWNSFNQGGANIYAGGGVQVYKLVRIDNTTGNVTKTYDGTTSLTAPTFSLVSPPAGATLVTGTAAFADKNAGTGKTVNYSGYSVTGGGSDGAGISYSYYLSAQPNKTGTINQASITIGGISAANKTYDATTAATLAGTPTVNALGADVVSVSGTGVGTFADKNAGNGKAVTVSGYTLSGADAGNYTVLQPAGLTADITPAALTLGGITANNKVYDGTTAAILNTAGADLSGVMSGDAVTLSGAGVGTFADKNVGSAKAVAVSGYALGGTDAGNYTVLQPSGLSADITPKTLTVSGITASNKVYDGTTAATVNTAGAVLTGLVAGDTVTVSANAAFADKNVGTGKTVSLSSLYGGADAGNYAITGQASTTANITPKSLTIDGVTASNKTYDGTTSATVSTSGAVLTGLVGGDDFTVTGASGSFADKNAGTGKTVAILGGTTAGADVNNYSVTWQASTTADITPAALTLGGITASNKVYDGTTAATLNTAGVSFGGLLGSDVVSLSGAGVGTFADKNVGSAKAVAVSGYTLGGTDAGNYTVLQPSGLSADITPKTLTVSGITASNKVYDGTTAATVNTAGAALTGLVAGDTVTVSANAAFADKNVGTGKTVSLSSLYGGADAGNYAFVQPSGLSANITPAPLTISGIAAADKSYDGTTAATVSTSNVIYTGLIGGDSVKVNATGAFVDPSVGNGKTVNLRSTYTGPDAGNYAITGQDNTTASIKPALKQDWVTAGELLRSQTQTGDSSESAEGEASPSVAVNTGSTVRVYTANATLRTELGGVRLPPGTTNTEGGRSE